MHDYPCSHADVAMYEADRRNAALYAVRQVPAVQPPSQLDDYSLADLYELEAQGEAMLRTLSGDRRSRMHALLGQIGRAITDRRGPENLAAVVCHQTANDTLTQPFAVSMAHTFARIQNARRHGGRR